MKFFTTLMSVLCSVAYSFSQDTLSPSKKHEFLTNGNIILKPSEIISNFRPAERPWLADRQYEWAEDDPVPFKSAYNLNAFDFFNSTAIHDTDLKKEMFKKTEEYTHLLDSLKSIKADFLNSVYYMNKLNQSGFVDGLKEDYDIKKGGFLVEIGSVLPYHCSRHSLPKVISDVEFKQLPIHKEYNLFQSKNSYTQYLLYQWMQQRHWKLKTIGKTLGSYWSSTLWEYIMPYLMTKILLRTCNLSIEKNRVGLMLSRGITYV